jgi:antitoxin HicB
MTCLRSHVVLNAEPEGGYTVTVPSLPACITYGENVDEAIWMAKDAIALYICELLASGNLRILDVLTSFPE